MAHSGPPPEVDGGHGFTDDPLAHFLNDTASASTNRSEELQCRTRADVEGLPLLSHEEPFHTVELYCAATLVTVCVLSVLNNAAVLLSTFWIKRRPLSTTMRISLSLTGADTIASFLLGVSWFINNILNDLLPAVPENLEPLWSEAHGGCVAVKAERLLCMRLAMEALRLGAVLVTMLHLLALAANHYLGALRPLHSHVRHAYLCIGLAAIWVVPEAALLAYFASFEDDGFRMAGTCGYRFLGRSEFHITFSLIFFLVLAVMIVIYVHIYIIVQRHERNRQRFRRGGGHPNGSAHSSRRGHGGHGGHGAGHEDWAGPGNVALEPMAALQGQGLLRATRVRRAGSPQFRRNKKAMVTTLFILGSYLVGWMPAVVSFVLVCDDCIIPRKDLNLRAYSTLFTFWAVNFLIVVKTLANSFIYTSRMKDIKDARRSMSLALARRCCRFLPLPMPLPQSADQMRVMSPFPSETAQQRVSLYSRSSRSGRHLNGHPAGRDAMAHTNV